METQEIIVLEAGVEVAQSAASAACCTAGPKPVLTEPEPTS